MAAAAALSACDASADRAAGAAPTVTDSAGVRIVQHHHLDAPEWTVDTARSVTVGQGPVDGLELFRVLSAIRTDDGGLAVADAGNLRVLLFAADGSFLASEGRQGEGPGEYGHVSLLARWAGDSLIVWDRQVARLSVLDADGVFARSFTLETTDDVPFANVFHVLDDGSFLANGFAGVGPGEMRTGRQAFDAPVYRFGSDGTFRVSLGASPSNESYFEVLDGGGFRLYPAVFPTVNARGESAGRLVLAGTDPFEIRYLDAEGATVQVVRGPPDAVPVTDALVDAEIDRLMAEFQGSRPEDHRRALTGMEYPETVPAFRSVFNDSVGRTWLELSEPGTDPETSTWVVVAPDGTLAGRIALPRRLRLTDAGDGYLVGVRTDALGVERVVSLELADG